VNNNPTYSEMYTSVGIATGYRLKCRGSVPILSEILFSTPSRPTSGPHSLMHGGGSWLKSQEIAAGQWPPSCAEVKNGGIVPPLRQMSPWHCAPLIRRREELDSVWEVNLDAENGNGSFPWVNYFAVYVNPP
jgi:hypothetical protein